MPAPVSVRASFGFCDRRTRKAEAAFSPSPRWIASQPVRAGSGIVACGEAARTRASSRADTSARSASEVPAEIPRFYRDRGGEALRIRDDLASVVIAPRPRLFEIGHIDVEQRQR